MGSEVQRLVSLSNIPTPYRVHFLRSLSCLLESKGISFYAMFMARSELGRQWTFDGADWPFNHRFVPGVHPILCGRLFHINPGGLAELLTRPPTWLLLSGSWYFPTVILASWIARLTGTKALFWSESNLAYVEHRSRLADWLRGLVLDSFDGFIIPGSWAYEYVVHFSPSAAKKPTLRLPNVVDESLYRDEVKQRRQHRPELLARWHLEDTHRPILFTAARLEPVKGIRELLQAVLRCPQIPFTLLIAGDGTLRNELKATIQEAGVDNRVRLLGFLSETGILDLLALSDAFILPSVGDPYPLAVIEAAFAGLPLLLSDRVGCHPEALMPGGNGLLFNPYDLESIRQCLEIFLGLGPEGWAEMGDGSLALAEERFSTERVVSAFLEELLTI